MAIESLTIEGYRGFGEKQKLCFAKPTGEVGSGLTVLVGPNSGGKSTVLESLRALSQGQNPVFSVGKRNKSASGKVSLIAETDDSVQSVKTVDAKGGQTVREPGGKPIISCYVLPSRRTFNPYFGPVRSEREQYTTAYGLPDIRSTPTDNFARRLFVAQEKRSKFNEVLAKVIGTPPDWFIELSDQGQHYLSIESEGHYHNSDGLGDGIVSLLFLVDALYDSNVGDIVVIDEPELSLHPAFQRRLAQLFADYSRHRQIILATHSPYFVDFAHIFNGAEVARVHKRNGSSIISQPSRKTVESLTGFLENFRNPHVLGLDAREAFFKDDGIVIVEGQEDVVFYPKVLQQLVQNGHIDTDAEENLQERFFGWGSGGASNIGKISALLNDLGFERVVGILDKDEESRIPELQVCFKNYSFLSIPAEDVRTKEDKSGTKSKRGLLDEGYILRPEFAEETGKVFKKTVGYLRDCSS